LFYRVGLSCFTDLCLLFQVYLHVFKPDNGDNAAAAAADDDDELFVQTRQ